MTAMPPLRDILNNTPVNAIDVDFDFKTIQSHIGSELINRDGSVAMTAPLSTQPPTAPQHAATKAYADGNVIAVGVINMFGGSVAPAGWALCDGASKSTGDSQYAALFAVIGYAYGGSGANFNLPNLQGRLPIGRVGALNPAIAGSAATPTLNAPGGSKDLIVVSHAHTVNNHVHDLSSHQHTVPQHGHTNSVGQPNPNANHAHAAPGGGSWGFFTRSPGIGTLAINVAAGSEAWAQQQFTTIDNAPHNHVVTIDDKLAFNTNAITNNSSGGATPGTDSQGASGTDKNLPPYVVVNFIIRIGI